MEEYLNHCRDMKKTAYIVLLDGKSAFDVVVHDNLMRKLFNIGVDDNLWTLIDDLHKNSTSCVKWDGEVSQNFNIYQGVRQGGILSSDLYKIYLNPLLNRLQASGHGARIGNVTINAPACADDLSLCSDTIECAQILTNIATDYSNTEGYELQILKSVLLKVEPTNRAKSKDEPAIKINNSDIKTVETTVHLGITRSTSKEKTLNETISANVKKARRTCYSLMSAGLHGHNGLDPETSLHLVKTYVIPTLMYGLEILVPKGKQLETIDNYLKRLLKQILHLPTSTADPVPYILSGFLPCEAQLDIQILTFFNNICKQDDNSIEKQLAQWQLRGSCSENSWFHDVRKILAKYELPSAVIILENPPTKYAWKRQVAIAVNTHWKQKIINTSALYSTLHNLNYKLFTPGKTHPLIRTISASTRDVTRMAVKLKLVSGTYVLQTNRAKYNKSEVDPSCLLCGSRAETTPHFILECSKLREKRQPIINDIIASYRNVTNTNFINHTVDEQTKIIMDPSFVRANTSRGQKCDAELQNLEFHTRRLCYNLHCERHKQLSNLNNKSKPKSVIRQQTNQPA